MTGSRESRDATVPAVAIVGLGPRGLYCLERLLAEFHAGPLPSGLHVHAFNRSAPFGVSPIYDPDQPDYILLNVSVGEIDLWTAETPPSVAGRGLSFTEWYNETFRALTPLSGHEFVSRAVVGRYLAEGFRRVADHLPPGVTLSCHTGEVIAVHSSGPAYDLVFRDGSGHEERIRADKILLATGHSRIEPGAEEQRYRAFADRHPRSGFIPFVYPVVEAMAEVPSSSRVAFKGLGLSFIDAVLGLTEGRGGRFERLTTGCLTYRKSGAEPRALIPFCRTGLPMTPKAHDLPDHMRPLTFVTAERLRRMMRSKPGGRLDLDADLWPLIRLDMDLYYYRAVMGPGAALQRLEACGPDAAAVRREIDAYLRGHPDREPFDPWRLVDPLGDRRFASGADFADFIDRYLVQEIARARRGHAGCAAKAAIDIWYEVRSALSPIIQAGGLTPDSHRTLLEHYGPLLKRVVFGPPIINIEKLLALLRAGMLDLSVARNPCIVADEASGLFELRCDDIPGAVAHADVLVDARYPAVDVSKDATPLYRSMSRQGRVRAWENPAAEPGSSGYRSGAIDFRQGPGFVVDDTGAGNESIAVIGIPTEGTVLGNLTLTRDTYSDSWAREVMTQLRRGVPGDRPPLR